MDAVIPEPTRVRRRSVVASAAALSLAALAGCSVPRPRRKAPAADPAPGLAIAGSRHTQLMQIAAHPDDDLYFMNPDARRMIDAGIPLLCVYVTAGEHDGRNHIPGRGRTDTPADPPAYSSARHQGLRQSYAEAIGLGRFTPWRKDLVTLRGGRRAEINTLTNGARRVDLVFLNLPMHTPRRWMALPALWSDRRLELRTVIATDSPVLKAETYDYDKLVDVLAGLMETYRPTVIHTLDPDPDIQHSDEKTRKFDSEQPGYSDHGDHTAVASFSWAAMVRRVAEATKAGGTVPAFAATAFRGYYNRHWPKNLPPQVLREKAARLVPYGGDASWKCGNPSGCGDYSVGGDRPLKNVKGWVRATHYRYPGTGPAVVAEEDGRLTAYGVLGLRAVRWRENAPGGGLWGEPEDLGGGPLAPALGSATLADGRVLLFGLRFAALGGHGGPNRREIVLLEQRSPGGPFLAWKGLDNPERGDDRGRRIGVPVAVAAPDGRVHLFVRNADKGVSTRVRRADGSWERWRTLPGDEEVQDGLRALVDGRGRVHLFAAGREEIRHWVDGVAAAPLPGAGDPVGAVATAAAVELYFRAPATKELLTVPATGGRARTAAFDGYGAVTAAADVRGTVLLGRDLRGRVQLRRGGSLHTRTQGVVALGDSALRLTPQGAVAVGIGADAHPWTWRPEHPATG
ncbi:PIG-L family deacetylase [Streptomyces sp. NPDC048629]|uniref:PIG-L family deacetylase n=1 Tax=Streptomyces sp. NPDC048629 TaxID=3154824 RepID=UPI00343B9E5F